MGVKHGSAGREWGGGGFPRSILWKNWGRELQEAGKGMLGGQVATDQQVFEVAPNTRRRFDPSRSQCLHLVVASLPPGRLPLLYFPTLDVKNKILNKSQMWNKFQSS